jgi:hypothetical protein
LHTIFATSGKDERDHIKITNANADFQPHCPTRRFPSIYLFQPGTEHSIELKMKYAEGPPKLVAWLAQASNKPHSSSHAKTTPILSDYKVGGGGLSDEFSGLEVALIEPLFCVLSACA